MDAGVGSEIVGAVDAAAVEGYEKLCCDGRKNAVCLERREAMINGGGKGGVKDPSRWIFEYANHVILTREQKQTVRQPPSLDSLAQPGASLSHHCEN